jgi:hypothetical protein
VQEKRGSKAKKRRRAGAGEDGEGPRPSRKRKRKVLRTEREIEEMEPQDGACCAVFSVLVAADS